MWGGGVAYGTDGGEGGEFEDVFDGGFGRVEGGRFDEGCVFDHDGEERRGGLGVMRCGLVEIQWWEFAMVHVLDVLKLPNILTVSRSR